jgi:hypothetical protein
LILRLAAGDDTPSAYRFDELTGLWLSLPAASLNAGANQLELSIEQLGIYAAGEPLPELACAGVRLTDGDGKGLSGAALRFRDSAGQEGSIGWTDGDGRACLPASPDRELEFESFAQSAGQLLAGRGQLSVGPAAASCGPGCVDAGERATDPLPLHCVSGRLAASGSRAPVELWLSGDKRPESRAATLKPGEAFCLDLIGEDRLRLASNLRCAQPPPLTAAGDSRGCGLPGCLDLGTIQCCAEIESCGDGYDDDCDQRVDEGCQCGDADCAGARAAHSGGDFCCTDGGSCGLRDRDNPRDAAHCYDVQLGARNDAEQCGDEILDLGKGKQAVPGCCRPDQRCGLRIPPTDCVAREDSGLLLADGAPTLAAKSCRF